MKNTNSLLGLGLTSPHPTPQTFPLPTRGDATSEWRMRRGAATKLPAHMEEEWKNSLRDFKDAQRVQLSNKGWETNSLNPMQDVLHTKPDYEDQKKDVYGLQNGLGINTGGFQKGKHLLYLSMRVRSCWSSSFKHLSGQRLFSLCPLQGKMYSEWQHIRF